MLWLSRLDRVDPAGRGKVFYGEKLTWLGGWPYHHKRMNPARCATLLAEPTFCFVCKGFARIVRKWKVGSPRVALAGGWPFCLGQLFTGCLWQAQSVGGKTRGLGPRNDVLTGPWIGINGQLTVCFSKLLVFIQNTLFLSSDSSQVNSTFGGSSLQLYI